ncbi:hypothetical protein H311_00388 [Anncaliia algerae PRA109]|nr:hypothetical protein H311_00388 [Anncaliia algerae PRA109]
MRKNSDEGFKKHNKNTGTVNVKSKDLESTNEEITSTDKCMKEVVSESQNINIGSEKNLQNDNPKPILIPYSQILKISSMPASKDGNRMPDYSKNKAFKSGKKDSIENKKEKKTSLKFGRNTSINIATKNEKIQSHFYKKTSNEASVKKILERKNFEQVKNSKETDSISEIKTTNRYDQLEIEESKEIYDNETENSIEENISNDCINNPGTNQDRQMFKNHKKGHKKIKRGKNAGAI